MTLNDAERQIAAILRQLETDTDCVVESIEIRDIETTQIQDDRRQLLRRVVIELRRLPGQGWGP